MSMHSVHEACAAHRKRQLESSIDFSLPRYQFCVMFSVETTSASELPGGGRNAATSQFGGGVRGLQGACASGAPRRADGAVPSHRSGGSCNQLASRFSEERNSRRTRSIEMTEAEQPMPPRLKESCAGRRGSSP